MRDDDTVTIQLPSGDTMKAPIWALMKASGLIREEVIEAAGVIAKILDDPENFFKGR